jgi:hypothetical protein
MVLSVGVMGNGISLKYNNNFQYGTKIDVLVRGQALELLGTTYT